jgi:hypothetical protein
MLCCAISVFQIFCFYQLWRSEFNEEVDLGSGMFDVFVRVYGSARGGRRA